MRWISIAAGGEAVSHRSARDHNLSVPAPASRTDRAKAAISPEPGGRADCSVNQRRRAGADTRPALSRTDVRWTANKWPGRMPPMNSTRAVIVFQIVNKPGRAGIRRHQREPVRPSWEETITPAVACRSHRARPWLSRAVTIVSLISGRLLRGSPPAVLRRESRSGHRYAARRRQAILKMTLPGFSQRYCYEDAESGEYGNFHAHLLKRPPLRSGLFHIL